MKPFKLFISIALVFGAMNVLRASGSSRELFATSESFDMIAALQYFDKLKTELLPW